MKIITNRDQLKALTPSPLSNHLLSKFDDLVETEDDAPPIFIIVEPHDDITGPDYAFVGNRGLLSDLWEEHRPGQSEFSRPYEWVSHLPELQLYEVLLLVNNEDGYWIFLPDGVVEAYPDLKWVLASEEAGGLSTPQPL